MNKFWRANKVFGFHTTSKEPVETWIPFSELFNFSSHSFPCLRLWPQWPTFLLHLSKLSSCVSTFVFAQVLAGFWAPRSSTDCLYFTIWPLLNVSWEACYLKYTCTPTFPIPLTPSYILLLIIFTTTEKFVTYLNVFSLFFSFRI